MRHRMHSAAHATWRTRPETSSAVNHGMLLAVIKVVFRGVTLPSPLTCRSASRAGMHVLAGLPHLDCVRLEGCERLRDIHLGALTVRCLRSGCHVMLSMTAKEVMNTN